MSEKKQELLDRVKGLILIDLEVDGDNTTLYFDDGKRLKMESYVDPVDPFLVHVDLILEQQVGMYKHYQEIDKYDSLDEHLENDEDIPDEEKEF